MVNVAAVCLIISCTVIVDGDDLEDFPLDLGPSASGSNQGPQSDRDINNLESGPSLNTLEQNRKDVMRRVVSAAMLKPGARLRLAQVMPILRTMSGPQRLALAALVSAQVMASPEEPPPPPVDPTQNVTSELMLPISQDIAAMFRGLGREEGTARSAEYRPHHEVFSRNRPPYNSIKNTNFGNRRETKVPTEMLAPPPPPPPAQNGPPPNRGSPSSSRQPQGSSPGHPNRSLNSVEPSGKECEFFSQSLCLEDNNYPKNDILISLRNSPNKDAFSSLLQDSKQDSKDLDPFGDHIERRQGDGSMESHKMCASRVEMAKPKRARTTAGAWKYIVNTGDYSQTLRLEMCLRPQSSCTYAANGIRTECVQVFNYHRLLTWDQTTGLAMDMFKVPTCCSCHIHNFMAPMPAPQTPVMPGMSHAAMFPDVGPDSNFVSPELLSQAMQRLPPGMKQGLRLRGEMGIHSIPKRESNGVSQRPSPAQRPGLIHRGPPLPLQHDSETPPRYPPYHNNLRRTSTRNHTERFDNSRPNVRVGVTATPNQRHPELPVDNLVTSTEPATQPTTTSTTPSRRINYSYHPIIDFFKTQTLPQTSEQRLNKADWTPITDGPRHNKQE